MARRGRARARRTEDRGKERGAQVVADMTRMDDGNERAAWDHNESEKDDEIGLCRRRRDSTERAGVPQTGRRLSGMQAAPLSLPCPPSVSRSGWVPRWSSLVPAHPAVPLRVPNPLRVPTYPWYCDFVVHYYHRQLRHAKRKCERTGGRAGTFTRLYMYVCICVRDVYTRICASTTLRHVLSRQSVQLATNAFPRGQTDQAS